MLLPLSGFSLNLKMLSIFSKATSEVGSAGLYLEDYFEEQLKLIFPDKVFPGGREEQMIPPLEDEIEEEEEQPMEQSDSTTEDRKPQSPAGKESPVVDGDMVPKKEPMPPAESENMDKENIEINEKESGEGITKIKIGNPPAEEKRQDDSPGMEQAENCTTADTETKDGTENENDKLLAENTEDTPDTENPNPQEASDQKG